MKKVFKYMGWDKDHLEDYDEKYGTTSIRELDGNDMVEAINTMAFLGDWDNFIQYTNEQEKIVYQPMNNFAKDMFWLFGNPENFFNLMEAWLNDDTGKPL